jgi:hypothetical protein
MQRLTFADGVDGRTQYVADRRSNRMYRTPDEALVVEHRLTRTDHGRPSATHPAGRLLSGPLMKVPVRRQTTR